MSSSLLATIHLISVNLFLLIYLTKTILLFANVPLLEKFTRATKALEMVVNLAFLISGTWLLIILGAVKMLMIIKFILIIISIPIAVIGFKKKNKILAIFSLLLIIGAYGLSEAGKKKPFIPSKVEVTGNADQVARLGIATYIANCAMCHGEDGKKMYREAVDLSLSGLDQSSIELIVREGSKVNGIMPAFKSTLTDEEIIAVSVYVQSLRK